MTDSPGRDLSVVTAFARSLAGTLRPQSVADLLVAQVKATFGPVASAVALLHPETLQLETVSGDTSLGENRRLIEAARTMGVSYRTIITRVVVPAALPLLLVALRLGLASSWTAVVAAELIGAPSGLGYAVEWYRELLMTPQVMSFIAVIGLLGYVSDRAVRALATRFTPWAVETRADA